METYCKGGQGPPRAVAPPKKKKKKKKKMMMMMMMMKKKMKKKKKKKRPLITSNFAILKNRFEIKIYGLIKEIALQPIKFVYFVC